MDARPRVEMLGIRKAFPGVLALDDVDLTLMPGEVHALLGENDAGKSKLIKVLTGALARDGGTVLLEGDSVDVAKTGEAQAIGISSVHQKVNLIPTI